MNEQPVSQIATPRPLRPGDIPGMLALIAEVFAEYDCVLNTEADDPYLLTADTYFREGGGEFWVLEDSGLVRATVGVLLHEDAGELKTLYVQKSLRRRGWGRRLTELAMSHARDAGKPRMILWSDTRFRDAHRLYRHMGFSEFGIRILRDTNNSTEFGFERLL